MQFLKDGVQTVVFVVTTILKVSQIYCDSHWFHVAKSKGSLKGLE